jgi:hypothetical protein
MLSTRRDSPALAAARGVVIGVALQALPQFVLLRALTKYAVQGDRALADRQKAALRQKNKSWLRSVFSWLFGFSGSITMVDRPLPPPVSRNTLTLYTIAYGARLAGYVLATVVNGQCPISSIPVVAADIASLAMLSVVRESAVEAETVADSIDEIDGVKGNRGVVRKMLGLRAPERTRALPLLIVAGVGAAGIVRFTAGSKGVSKADFTTGVLAFSALLDALAPVPQLGTFVLSQQTASDEATRKRLGRMKWAYVVSIAASRALRLTTAAMHLYEGRMTSNDTVGAAIGAVQLVMLAVFAPLPTPTTLA